MEPPPELDRGPRVVRQAFNDLRRWVISQRPLPSLDCDVYDTHQGRVIMPKMPQLAAKAAQFAEHPFRVYLRRESNQIQAGVHYYSRLYRSLRPNDRVTIAGLLSEDKTSGWFGITAGAYIWLEVEFDNNGGIVGANIRNSLSASFDLTLPAWHENSYCQDNGETEGEHAQKQKYARKLIAHTTAASAGIVMHQAIRTDQVLRFVCIDGKGARYPFDHEGGYPL